MMVNDESYGAYAVDGCVEVRVTKHGLAAPKYKKIPFSRTIARTFQDVENGGGTVKIEWVDGKCVAVRLHFPRGRRRLTFLRKQTKRLVKQFEFFELSTGNIPVCQLHPKILQPN